MARCQVMLLVSSSNFWLWETVLMNDPQIPLLDSYPLSLLVVMLPCPQKSFRTTARWPLGGYRKGGVWIGWVFFFFFSTTCVFGVREEAVKIMNRPWIQIPKLSFLPKDCLSHMASPSLSGLVGFFALQFLPPIEFYQKDHLFTYIFLWNTNTFGKSKVLSLCY